jgi:hypothetical protein
MDLHQVVEKELLLELIRPNIQSIFFLHVMMDLMNFKENMLYHI